MTCAEKIRAYRLDAKLSVKKLATKAGMQPQHLRELENMNGEQLVKDLYCIAQALGIPTIELFRDQPPSRRQATPESTAKRDALESEET